MYLHYKPLTVLCLILFWCVLGQPAHAHTAGKYQSVDTTIRGKISDSTGTGLPGVSVTVKGTQSGTTTGPNGDFVLYNVPSRATLVISNVGYQPREVRLAGGQTSVSLSIYAEAGTLTDVIVTGFQRIDKSKFTGAAVKLGMDQIKT